MATVHVPDAAPPALSGQPLITSPKEGDYVELPAGKSAADVTIKFGVAPGRLAFWIEFAEDPSKVGQMNCLPRVPEEAYALRGIPEGSFRVHAVLWEALDPLAPVKEPQKPSELQSGGSFVVSDRMTASFFVRRFEDFVPRYEWQPVEGWHRIPRGLEVIMDLGAGRRARIPQPWQWDATVEGEADRRRVGVEAESTMASLLGGLGFDASTHEVVWRQADGKFERVLDGAWTARQADLFRYEKDVLVRRRGSPA